MQYDFREILKKDETDFQENYAVTNTVGSHTSAKPKETRNK